MERIRETKAKGKPSKKPSGLQSPSPQHISSEFWVDRMNPFAERRKTMLRNQEECVTDGFCVCECDSFVLVIYILMNGFWSLDQKV